MDIRMTFDEWDAFQRDMGRPADPFESKPPIDPETMYRAPESRLERTCRLTKEEIDAVMAEYNAWPYGSDSTDAEADSTPDAINPDHYKVGGIETIDYMRAKSTPEEFEGYLRLSALKYLSRVGHKHGDHDAARAEEYRKALWFIERLVREVER
jgi:hypothetical protein